MIYDMTYDMIRYI